MSKEAQDLKEKKERSLLVIVDFGKVKRTWPLERIEEEMEELVISCGGYVVDHVTVKIKLHGDDFKRINTRIAYACFHI